MKTGKGVTLKAIFVVIIEVVMEIIVPFLTMSIIDEGIYGGNMNALLKFGGFMLLCVVIGLISGAAAGIYSADASSGFARNLRKDLYYKIQGFSFANIDKFTTPGLVTRLTTDVTNIQNAYQVSMDQLMEGRTTFVIAHRLSTIQNSDVIMVLDHGRIIERGSHESLIAKRGTYYQLYTGAFELE